MAIRIEKEGCTACGSCEKACGIGAIMMKDGFAMISESCTSCGACIDSCPKGVIKSDAVAK